jgi:hypothetical protein
MRFLHIRECDEEGALLNCGGCTIAFTPSKEMEAIFVAMAICHPKDQFVKKIGRELAAERLKSKDGPLDIVPFNHPYSDVVRLWFMQYFDVSLVHNEGRWMTDWLYQSLEDEDAAEDDETIDEPPLIKDEEYSETIQRV